MPPWKPPCEKSCCGLARGRCGWPACIGWWRSCSSSAVITALDVSGPGTSYGLHEGSISYAYAKFLFCVTEAVLVDGAMFDETTHL